MIMNSSVPGQRPPVLDGVSLVQCIFYVVEARRCVLLRSKNIVCKTHGQEGRKLKKKIRCSVAGCDSPEFTPLIVSAIVLQSRTEL